MNLSFKIRLKSQKQLFKVISISFLTQKIDYWDSENFWREVPFSKAQLYIWRGKTNKEGKRLFFKIKNLTAPQESDIQDI